MSPISSHPILDWWWGLNVAKGSKHMWVICNDTWQKNLNHNFYKMFYHFFEFQLIFTLSAEKHFKLYQTILSDLD